MIQQNPPYNAESFEAERKRIRAMMYDFMVSCEEEMREKPAPPAQLPTRNLVIAWLTFFEPDVSQLEPDIDRLSICDRDNIHAAFMWVKENYAELDLGGNYKWRRAAYEVLGYINRNEWNNENEASLFLWFMTDTRWYLYQYPVQIAARRTAPPSKEKK